MSGLHVYSTLANISTEKQENNMYILSLCMLAENCDYSAEQNEQEICGRLTIGIWDAKLTEATDES